MRININSTKEEAHRIWDNWRRSNPETYRKLIKECLFCGTKQKLCLHHIDGDKRNNEISNLQCLCNKCHFKLHKNFQIAYIREERESTIIKLPTLQELKDEWDAKFK